MTYVVQPLEVAAGAVFDPCTRRPPYRFPRTDLDGLPWASPRVALEGLLLRALLAGPCTVSFSGGRDSSLILAVACHVARREGLALPVPVSMRHADAASDETGWQERVIDHLGLTEWQILDIADDMDVLGEQATGLLEVTGVQSPPNAYLHLPVAAATPRGGVVLTGAGGDEILGGRAVRVMQVLSGRARPAGHDLRAAAGIAAPGVVRRRHRARDGFPTAPWLTEAAARAAAERTAAEQMQVRLRWDFEALMWAGSRSVLLGRRGLDQVGVRHGVSVHSPLLDERFIGAFAHAVGPAGPRSRTHAMAELAGDLLPPDVVARATKAVFRAMVWGPRFREFVSSLDPHCLRQDIRDLVDPDRLRAAWDGPTPPFASMMLAQQAWLDTVSTGPPAARR